MIESIEKALTGLTHMPHRYSLVDDKYLSAMGYRMLPVKNYLAFFTVDEDTGIVYIERVLYARRDWLHIL